MVTMKRWTIDIDIDEDERGRTYVRARLHTGAPTTLIGFGRAKLSPADDNVPEIGDGLATARALTDLGHRLLVTAAKDIQENHGPWRGHPQVGETRSAVSLAVAGMAWCPRGA